MAIRIVPHGIHQKPAVEAFNQRMRAGNSPGFYVDPDPTWIPKRPGAKAWREYYLALEDSGEVRGAYALKPQQWWIRGEVHWVSDWQGPFSEGAVDPRYATVALRMLRDMQKKQPRLYSMGHGGSEQAVVQLVRTMGFRLHGVAFAFRAVRPYSFLRHNGYLRSSPRRRVALDLLACTGMGSVGLTALHTGLALRRRPTCVKPQLVVEPRFGAWADALWERCAPAYSALAVRDADMMNTLVPARGWPSGIRLRVTRSGNTIGWAVVLHKRMKQDARFGNMHVGLIADCFGAPADASDILHVAYRYLARQHVDLVYANLSHPAWVRGLADNGFIVLKDRRLFAVSPGLEAQLTPFDEMKQGLHLTNLDGHGPDGFD